ncbi:putative beta-lysine N-acetyltransferase [Methanolobus vulcani]|uniref:Putative beta-lysine N-acetyltransferase n=1 Tax=Methanolobus vulcani TaxID=38026 RepID=A0A7Z8P2Q2_9EURY|nr:putative beta-lysine N-acetyltransferase [Methanolobus vulcani]TQD26785.1 putative beta-lysine N-acetyltransferase [Methanolobus vulcani]
MHDQVLKINNSVIQHGPFNDRVYLMKLSPEDYGEVPAKIEGIAESNGYSKIFSKIPSSAKDYFQEISHVEEAYVPGMYNGTEGASFMAKFLSNEREKEITADEVEAVISTALSKINSPKEVTLSGDEDCFVCTGEDVQEMAKIYDRVFASYPFPIKDPQYLLRTMQENLIYFGIRKAGKIVALASCEMDVDNSNVEMTDFATLPEYRGRGYSYYLLRKMESKMREMGIITAYTIARARSYGMNITFSRSSYSYAGTLVNNTNISGSIESMNVWYKKLDQM